MGSHPLDCFPPNLFFPTKQGFQWKGGCDLAIHNERERETSRKIFLAWNQSIKVALGEKLKLGFIDGSTPKPSNNSHDFVKWNQCDYMGPYWILNSMLSELS